MKTPPADPSLILLKQNIAGFIQKHYLNLTLKGVIYFVSLLLVLFMLFSLTAYFTWPGTFVRGFIFYLTLVILGTFLFYFVLSPLSSWLKLGKKMDERTASMFIGRHFPEVGDKLLNTLQLEDSGNSDTKGNSASLVAAGISQRAKKLNKFTFSSAVDLRQNVHYLRFVFLPLTALLVLLLVLPGALTEGASRILHFSTVYLRPAPFKFDLLSSSEFEANKPYKVILRLTGKSRSATASLIDGVTELPLKNEGAGIFTYSYSGSSTDHNLVFAAAGFVSKAFHVSARQPARLSRFTLTLVYPRATHLRPEIMSTSGDFSVPEGTMATWRFQGDHTSYVIEAGSTSTKLLPHGDDRSFSSGSIIRKDASFVFYPKNQTRYGSDSLHFNFRSIKDLLPVIQVSADSLFSVSPGLVNRNVHFAIALGDDYGISTLTAYESVTQDGKPAGKPIVVPVAVNSSRSQTIAFQLNPGKLISKPGSGLSLWFEVRDNNYSQGRVPSKSQIFNFEVPTLNSQQEDLAKDARETKQQFLEAGKLASQISLEARALNEKLANSSLSFEEKSQAESLLRKEEELERKLSALTNTDKNNSKSEKDFKQQKTGDQHELEKRMDELIDQQTKNLLEQLKKILAENNKNQLRENLQKLDDSDHSRADELKRLNELYKREMAIRQRELLREELQTISKAEKSMSTTPGLQNQQEEQEKATKQFEDVLKKETELSKSENKQGLDEQSKSKVSEIKSLMSDAEKNIKKKKSKSAKEDQSKASDKLNDLAETMHQKDDDEQMEEARQDLSSLRPILENLLRVSFSQEDIMNKLAKLRPSDPSFRDVIRKESDLKDDLGFIQDSVVALAKKIPQIQGFVNKEFNMANVNMKAVVQLLSDHRQYEAAGKQQFVMTAVNNLAVMLSNTENALQKAAQSRSGKGSKKGQPGLAKLLAMQKELNSDLNKPGVQKQNGSGSEEFAKLASRQEAIRRELQRLLNSASAEAKKSGNEAGKKMEQTERDLLNKTPYSELLSRQKQIMTRMLEADNAQRKQEEDMRREGVTGQDTFKRAPNVNSLIKPFRRDLSPLSARSEVLPGINSFYKPKINSYFDQIKEGK